MDKNYTLESAMRRWSMADVGHSACAKRAAEWAAKCPLKIEEYKQQEGDGWFSYLLELSGYTPENMRDMAEDFSLKNLGSKTIDYHSQEQFYLQHFMPEMILFQALTQIKMRDEITYVKQKFGIDLEYSDPRSFFEGVKNIEESFKATDGQHESAGKKGAAKR